MDDTGARYSLPDGSSALMLGPVAILSHGPERTAVCRACGRELGRWRAGEVAPRLRCECAAAEP